MVKTNKRGFTLIELLGVVTVLAIILIIAIPTTSYLIKKQRKNYYVSLESSVSLAGRDYFNSNRLERPSEILENKGVTLDLLKNDDYITEVTDADGNDTCTGYVYVIKNEKKEYEYISCISCKCEVGENNCEYISEHEYCHVAEGSNTYNVDAARYDDIWLYVNSNYKPSILNAGIIITRQLGSREYSINDAIGYSSIWLNGEKTELNITEPNIFQLKYETKYEINGVEIDIFAEKPKRNLYVYQYQAPSVTYNSVINNSMTNGGYYKPLATEKEIVINNLKPNLISPTSLANYPAIKVQDYLYSYRLKDTEDWSSWNRVDCGSQTDNVRNNCTINISNFDGAYQVRFAFNDKENNISAETSNFLRIEVKKEPPMCPDLTISGIFSEHTGSKWYRTPVKIDFTLPNNVNLTKSYINNPTGDTFIYNQADINGNGFIDKIDALIILRKAVGISTGRLLGDLDGNGNISVTEARTILRFAVKLESFTDEEKALSDINQDGYITVADARLALRCAVNMEPCPIIEYSNNKGDINGDGIIDITDAQLVLKFEDTVGFDNYIEVNNFSKIGNNYSIILSDNNFARMGKFEITNEAGIKNVCYTDPYQIDRTIPIVDITTNGGSFLTDTSNSFEEESINLLASTKNNLSGESFQWKKNGQNIDGATSNILTITESGTYSAVLTTGSGIEVESSSYKFVKEVPEMPLACPVISANKQKTTWINSDVTFNFTHNDTYTFWEWYTRTNSDNYTLHTNNGKEITQKSIAGDGIRQGKIVIKNSAGETKTCYTDVYYIDKTAPTCSVSISGTKGTNDWYKGNSIIFNLKYDSTPSTIIAPISGYGLINSTTATYNNVTSKKITTSTEGIKYYGYIKDKAGNIGSCNSGASNIKFENADNVKLKIVESVWNNLKSTSSNLKIKNKLLFPGNSSSVWFNSSYGLSSSYKNIRTNWDTKQKKFTGIVNNAGPVTTKSSSTINYYSRSCMNVYDTPWESALKVEGATSGISSKSTSAEGKLCDWAGSDQNNIKYDYNKCSSRTCTNEGTINGNDGQKWNHYFCAGNNVAYRKWTVTTKAGNSASVATYVEFFGQCGYGN